MPSRVPAEAEDLLRKDSKMDKDILIKNGTVMDGTGAPAARADLIIREDRIEDVGSFPDAQAGKRIDPTQLKTKLSFLLAKAMGKNFTVRNQLKTMPSHRRANELIARALERGVDVGHDMLPWVCAFTSLLAILPPRLYAGGMARLLEQLRDPEARKAVIKEKESVFPRWPTWEHGWWTDNMFDGSFMLSGFKLEKNRPYENMRLQDIAEERGTDLYNTAFDLIVEEERRLFFVYSIDDQTISDWIGAWAISDPNCAIMTDIVGVDYPNPSPVSYGAFTKVVGQFARDEQYRTQEEATTTRRPSQAQ
jgi:N-acyl-D-aspartate/D-glutamate deacylase